MNNKRDRNNDEEHNELLIKKKKNQDIKNSRYTENSEDIEEYINIIDEIYESKKKFTKLCNLLQHVYKYKNNEKIINNERLLIMLYKRIGNYWLTDTNNELMKSLLYYEPHIMKETSFMNIHNTELFNNFPLIKQKIMQYEQIKKILFNQITNYIYDMKDNEHNNDNNKIQNYKNIEEMKLYNFQLFILSTLFCASIVSSNLTNFQIKEQLEFVPLIYNHLVNTQPIFTKIINKNRQEITDDDKFLHELFHKN